MQCGEEEWGAGGGEGSSLLQVLIFENIAVLVLVPIINSATRDQRLTMGQKHEN